MDVFIYPTVCSLCGGEGFSNVEDIIKPWKGHKGFHKDPRDCQTYMRKKEKELATNRKAGNTTS